jgi:ABC-type thiamine transport system substrate-binding protein
MLAAPLARFEDPPATFNRAHTNLVLAAYVAYSALVALSVWGVGIFTANLISSHPDDVQCVFRNGCNFAYDGQRETVADVSADPHANLIRARVTFINHSSSPQAISTDYWLHPVGSKPLEIGLSRQCEVPQPETVAARSRVTQTVCFEVSDTNARYDLHLPWTGLQQDVRIASP